MKKKISFIIFLSLLVGISTALAACLLKWAIHAIQHLLTTNFTFYSENWLYLLYPIIGIILASLFVRYVVRDDISHGVTKILYAISQRKSIIKLHNMWSSVVASSITIGFGGSVGAESPVVLTGAAIGSNLGRAFKMDQKTLMLMVGCGAAGAISGIFKAPITGVAFTLEVLMLDMTFYSVVPLQSEAFALDRIPYYVLLGILCGFVSLYFTRGMNWMEGIFRKLEKPWKKILLGGIMLSLLIFLLPPLYGEGYDSINSLLNLDYTRLLENSLFYEYRYNVYFVIGYFVLIVLLKIFASAATNGAGGTGGLFAPSLFVGCITGYILVLLLQQIGVELPAQNFALAGMAGLMSGIMHAPLTGIFLTAELSGGYDLFMPLMIVSVFSFITIYIFEPHSLYAMRLAQKGELVTHHKDKAVLSLLKTENLIETDMRPIAPEALLGDLVKIMSVCNRNVFPVIDNDGIYLGEIRVEEVRNIMFRPELYQRFNMQKLMVSPRERVDVNDSMEVVMKNLNKAMHGTCPY